MRYLDADERSTLRISEGGPEVNIISEAGLYTLILRSNKPEAKLFKRWVTHEVLPSIRKHGAYMTPETIEKVLNVAQGLGFTEKAASGNTVVRWARARGYLKSFSFVATSCDEPCPNVDHELARPNPFTEGCRYYRHPEGKAFFFLRGGRDPES